MSQSRGQNGDLLSFDGDQQLIQRHVEPDGAPTAGDDATLGYEVGSMWIDATAGKAYICTDATDGAAVWGEVTFV